MSRPARLIRLLNDTALVLIAACASGIFIEAVLTLLGVKP
jgi:hypothetical protein